MGASNPHYSMMCCVSKSCSGDEATALVPNAHRVAPAAEIRPLEANIPHPEKLTVCKSQLRIPHRPARGLARAGALPRCCGGLLLLHSILCYLQYKKIAPQEGDSPASFCSTAVSHNTHSWHELLVNVLPLCPALQQRSAALHLPGPH